MRTRSEYRSVVGSLIVATAIMASGGGLAADEDKFPTRPITIVEGVGAGGFLDISARIVSEQWQKELGTPISVTNPGGGPEVTMLQVLRRPNDGYTVAAREASVDQMLFGGFTSDRLTTEDMAPLGGIAQQPQILLVSKAVAQKRGWTSAAEFLKDLKSGTEKITVADIPNTTNSIQFKHLLLALGLNPAGDSRISLVGFPSGGAARTAVAGGHVMVTVAPVASYVQFKEQTDVLFVFGDKNPLPSATNNAPPWPAVSSDKLEYLPSTQYLSASAALKKAHPAVYRKLVETLKSAMSSPDHKERMEKAGYATALLYQSPEQMTAELSRLNDVISKVTAKKK